MVYSKKLFLNTVTQREGTMSTKKMQKELQKIQLQPWMKRATLNRCSTGKVALEEGAILDGEEKSAPSFGAAGDLKW